MLPKYKVIIAILIAVAPLAFLCFHLYGLYSALETPANEDSESFILALAIFSAVVLFCLILGIALGKPIQRGPQGPYRGPSPDNNIKVIE